MSQQFYNLALWYLVSNADSALSLAINATYQQMRRQKSISARWNSLPQLALKQACADVDKQRQNRCIEKVRQYAMH